MILDYALAILLAIGLALAGLVGLTLLWITVAEWHFWYKKWQTNRYGSDNE